MGFSAWTALWKSPRRRPWVAAGLLLAGMLLADPLAMAVVFPRGRRGGIYSTEDLPLTRVPVLVLGAGVLPDQAPTQVLQGRLETALSLFQQGKASWILVSGDNRAASYNEPRAMRRWLVRHGVPDALVVSDFAGRRTYDSLKRAQTVFGIRQLVIVTSDFHLPRALFLARHLGLDACGIPAATRAQPLATRIGFWAREWIARHVAAWDACFPPDTLLGHRETTPDDPAPEDPSPDRPIPDDPTPQASTP